MVYCHHCELGTWASNEGRLRLQVHCGLRRWEENVDPTPTGGCLGSAKW